MAYIRILLSANAPFLEIHKFQKQAIPKNIIAFIKHIDTQSRLYQKSLQEVYL